MAFDTLQRWHESSHVNPAGFHITPAVRYPIPRYEPWTAIAEGLRPILNAIDPLTIAQRRYAMQAMPLQLEGLKQANEANRRKLEMQTIMMQRQLLGLNNWSSTVNALNQPVSTTPTPPPPAAPSASTTVPEVTPQGSQPDEQGNRPVMPDWADPNKWYGNIPEVSPDNLAPQ